MIGDDQPAISVDTKKKELIGDYANGGNEWSPEGEPERVQVHDFADRALGEFAKAIPYGIYDIANNEGWVSVGDVADTAEFAVESIRAWWNQMGTRFPNATRLLITADAGGSNGYRLRAWKVHLARLAADTGLDITVCHYPPGTSKWNRIEHRMFSFITMNRGRVEHVHQRGHRSTIARSAECELAPPPMLTTVHFEESTAQEVQSCRTATPKTLGTPRR